MKLTAIIEELENCYKKSIVSVDYNIKADGPSAVVIFEDGGAIVINIHSTIMLANKTAFILRKHNIFTNMSLVKSKDRYNEINNAILKFLSKYNHENKDHWVIEIDYDLAKTLYADNRTRINEACHCMNAYDINSDKNIVDRANYEQSVMDLQGLALTERCLADIIHKNK